MVTHPEKEVSNKKPNFCCYPVRSYRENRNTSTTFTDASVFGRVELKGKEEIKQKK